MLVKDLYNIATKVYVHEEYSIDEFNKFHVLKENGCELDSNFNMDKLNKLSIIDYSLNEYSGEIILVLKDSFINFLI